MPSQPASAAPATAEVPSAAKEPALTPAGWSFVAAAAAAVVAFSYTYYPWRALLSRALYNPNA